MLYVAYNVCVIYVSVIWDVYIEGATLTIYQCSCSTSHGRSDIIVEIIRDVAVEEKILERVRAKNVEEEKERLSRIHISDIMNPREAVMKRRHGVRVTDTLLLTFLAGKGHHVLVQDILDTKENPLEFAGVIGSEDIHFEGFTHEFKSVRSIKLYAPSTDPLTGLPAGYPAQLRYYLAIEHPDKNEAEGYVTVFYLVYREEYRSKPTIRCYKCSYNDLDKAREEIILVKAKIEAVLRGELPISNLPLCIDCKKYRGKECAFLKECNGYNE